MVFCFYELASNVKSFIVNGSVRLTDNYHHDFAGMYEANKD